MTDEELELIREKLHESRKYDRTMADWARKYGMLLIRNATESRCKTCKTCKHWVDPYEAADGKTYGYCTGLTDMLLGHDPAESILTEPTFGCLRHQKPEKPHA